MPAHTLNEANERKQCMYEPQDGGNVEAEYEEDVPRSPVRKAVLKTYPKTAPREREERNRRQREIEETARRQFEAGSCRRLIKKSHARFAFGLAAHDTCQRNRTAL